MKQKLLGSIIISIILSIAVLSIRVIFLFLSKSKANPSRVYLFLINIEQWIDWWNEIIKQSFWNSCQKLIKSKNERDELINSVINWSVIINPSLSKSKINKIFWLAWRCADDILNSNMAINFFDLTYKSVNFNEVLGSWWTEGLKGFWMDSDNTSDLRWIWWIWEKNYPESYKACRLWLINKSLQQKLKNDCIKQYYKIFFKNQ